MVIVPVQDGAKEGDYLRVRITGGTSGTLFGRCLAMVDPYKESVALTA